MNRALPYKDGSYDRRKFLSQSARLAGGLGLLTISDWSYGAIARNGAVTVQDVINIILKEIPGAPFKDTVDTIKAGSADQAVTGIITTMFATIDVIQEAIARKANFIIAHEPTFYNHRDDREWVRDNKVVQKKLDLLNQHGIAVWRFHDHCHFFRPDFVFYGVAMQAGWLNYFKPGKTILEIPPVSLQQLVDHLKKSLEISHLRMIGDRDQVCTRISVMPGAAGGQMQVGQVLAEKPDVLIIGESFEWETVEFIRDGRKLGFPTALIVLGHSVSEEPGMLATAEWLKPRLPDINIIHIKSGDPFTWY